jgi:hypothetical protein
MHTYLRMRTVHLTATVAAPVDRLCQYMRSEQRLNLAAATPSTHNVCSTHVVRARLPAALPEGHIARAYVERVDSRRCTHPFPERTGCIMRQEYCSKTLTAHRAAAASSNARAKTMRLPHFASGRPRAPTRLSPHVYLLDASMAATHNSHSNIRQARMPDLRTVLPPSRSFPCAKSHTRRSPSARRRPPGHA